MNFFKYYVAYLDLDLELELEFVTSVLKANPRMSKITIFVLKPKRRKYFLKYILSFLIYFKG